ncbi:MAG TPA: hypothetical protein ENJ95_21345 [Bacteroidetes bacterium]|nr:hypothetical protein [Bacteroidota bacterium]
MKVLFSSVLVALLACLCTLKAQTNEQLVIFIQDGRSISQDFKRQALPEIKRIAQKNKLELRIVEASDGAPIEVAYTPAIFYQSDNGYTLFKGRYHALDDLKSFVKSKGQTQPASYAKADNYLLIWNIGRATLTASMKVHPLSGRPPKAKKFQAQKFEAEAVLALAKGMDYFKHLNMSDLPENAKSYRMEFFPKVEKGVLLVQMKLYSQFDNQVPVFKTSIPSGYEWKEWHVAFEKAGNRIEKALVAQISNGYNGDGFDTLKETTPQQSWGYLPSAADASYGDRD